MAGCDTICMDFFQGQVGEYELTVSVDPTQVGLVVGEAKQLKETVLPSFAPNKNVVWFSSDTDVATVTAGGLVTAIGAGSCTIFVETVVGGAWASCLVTVTALPNDDDDDDNGHHGGHHHGGGNGPGGNGPGGNGPGGNGPGGNGPGGNGHRH
ncbi:MAG: Ig-like domain-containing protein [Prevotellaceae bacterium]|nr:Ig-like domain-containing protein [Prevotellaceae bacterium]